MMDGDGGGPGDSGDLHQSYPAPVVAGRIYAGFTQSSWLN